MHPDYAAILAEAHSAAQREAKAVYKRYGDHGACGFAWVTIDGKHPLAAHCRKQVKSGGTTVTFGSKGYPSGWQFWCPGRRNGTQSVVIVEAGARAFRDALASYGIRADTGSRLD